MIKESAKNFINHIKSQIALWLDIPEKDLIINYKAEGGSALILEIAKKDNLQDKKCFKILKEDQIKENSNYYKLLKEIYHLLISSNSGKVVPVLSNKLEEVKANDPIVGILSNKIEELQKNLKSKTLCIEKVIGQDINKILCNIKSPSENFLIGYVMREGYSLEDCLIQLSEGIKRKTSTNQEELLIELPRWLIKALVPQFKSKIDFDEKKKLVLNHFSNNVGLWIPQFISQCIEDILYAIKDIHSNNLLHLDVKEANIMVLPEREEIATTNDISNKLPIRFVLSDFGSSENIENLKKPSSTFETTYQYLPKGLRSEIKLKSFTSFKRVPISTRLLKNKKMTFHMIDLHALSVIINNFLTNEEFKRISAVLSDEDFEEAYSFSELISVDFRNEDYDSIYPNSLEGFSPENSKSLIMKAINLFNKGREFERKANEEWIKIYENILDGKAKNYKININGQSTNIELKDKLHPASILYEFEKKCEEKLKIRSEDEYRTKIDKISTELSSLKNLSGFRRDLLKISLLGKNYDFSPLLDSEMFERLNKVHQLGLTFLLNPDKSIIYANQSRLDHSIGTALLTKAFILSLLRNSAWFRYRYKEEDGIFLLLSALLHDIGHYPLAHFLEGSRIFPNHEQLTNAIILGKLDTLGLNDRKSSNFLAEKRWKSPENKNSTDYDKEGNSILSICNAKDLYDFHNTIKSILQPAYAKYGQWYNYLISSDTHINVQSFEDNDKRDRLIHRVFLSIINGPIDADKLHYIFYDSLYCNLGIASIIDEKALINFFDSLKISYRHLPESTIQRYCLGVREDSGNIPQLLIFLRAAMFDEIYWSKAIRAKMTLLLYTIYKTLKIIFKYEFKGKPSLENESFLKLLDLFSKWISGTDVDAEKSLNDLINMAKKIQRNGVEDIDDVDFDSIKELIFGDSYDSGYEEICRIYPNESVAYDNIIAYLDKIKVKRKQKSVGRPIDLMMGEKNHFYWHTSSLRHQIRNIIIDKLQITEKDLNPGALLIDIPYEQPSRKNEFKRFALVDNLGFGHSIGDVWNTIEDYLNKKILIIRILIHNKFSIDAEEKRAIRDQIIKHFT